MHPGQAQDSGRDPDPKKRTSRKGHGTPPWSPTGSATAPGTEMVGGSLQPHPPSSLQPPVRQRAEGPPPGREVGPPGR